MRALILVVECDPHVRTFSAAALPSPAPTRAPATIVATQIAEREGVPFVCATDVDPLITSRGFKYTFRTSPIVESYARDLLTYVKSKEWVTVAPKEYAKTTAVWPKPKWGA